MSCVALAQGQNAFLYRISSPSCYKEYNQIPSGLFPGRRRLGKPYNMEVSLGKTNITCQKTEGSSQERRAQCISINSRTVRVLAYQSLFILLGSPGVFCQPGLSLGEKREDGNMSRRITSICPNILFPNSFLTGFGLWPFF